MDDSREMLDLIKVALEEYVGAPYMPMAQKWKTGVLVLEPGNPAQQSKRLEIEKFFHKLVMVRESLRVLEQKINTHEKLDDEDRVQLQHYITRVYGTLTTFNVLFRDEEDRFTGQKS